MEINVGENGANLSGGQKQRIGLARALYKDFDILILDESTNSLDSDTANQALEQIFKHYSLKTIIIISHDLNSLKICDKIYSLINGKINLMKI
jgi:ATP-binding cassette subfamily B protein